MSKQECVEEVNSFNEFYEKLSPVDKESYGRKSSLDLYTHCHSCGNDYKNFKDALPDDCPDGCTIGPIMNRNE
jgi:hypothetical protein